MSFFSNIFSRSKSYLGVDIGTTSIKIAELTRGGHNPTLSNYALLESVGHFERATNVIQANALKISEKETVEMLKILLKKVKFSTTQTVASIPAFASFVTLIEMPEMNEDEMGKTMGFLIKQNIPLPLADIAVDWIRVGRREDESGFVKQQVLVVAIPNETIERYRDIFKKAGLNLKALEVEMLAYSRSIVGSDQTPTIVADIGARSTNISVVDQGFLKNNNQIDYAGDNITQSIVKGLGVSYRRGEDLKIQRGLSGGGGEYELSTLEFPFVDVIINEIRKIKDKSETESGIKLQRVLLIGGGSNLIGLDRYIEQQLGIPTMLGNSFLYVDAPTQLLAVEKEIKTRFATAIGLAMKNFIS